MTAYFKEVEFRLGRHLVVSDYAANIEAADALREFAELKFQWPYRRDDFPGPCNYFFENGLYPRPGVFRKTQDIGLSPYENILKELDTSFSSAKESAAADKLLDELFFKTERALCDSPSLKKG